MDSRDHVEKWIMAQSKFMDMEDEDEEAEVMEPSMADEAVAAPEYCFDIYSVGWKGSDIGGFGSSVCRNTCQREDEKRNGNRVSLRARQDIMKEH